MSMWWGVAPCGFVVTALIAILIVGAGDGSLLASTHVTLRIHMTGPLAGWAFRVPQERGDIAVLHTADGGVHWANVTPPASQDIFEPAVLTATIAWVESCAPLKVVGTGAMKSCKLLHTVDSGRNWTELGRLPSPEGDFAFIDTRRGWLMITTPVAGSENTWIHRTLDGGHTWVEVASATYRSEASGLPFGGGKSGIVFLNPTTGWVTGYTVGCNFGTYFFATHDSGRTWRQQKLPVPAGITSDRNESAMPPIFLSTRDGVLPVSISYAIKNEYCESGRTVVVFYATHDGGTTWKYTTPVVVKAGINAPPSSFADMNHGWVTQGNVLYKTADGGRRWTQILLPPAFADIQQLDFISPKAGWATRETAPFLLKTVDGGQMWVPVDYTISRP